MKKLVTITMAIIAAAATLTGCGSDEEPQKPGAYMLRCSKVTDETSIRVKFETDDPTKDLGRIAAVSKLPLSELACMPVRNELYQQRNKVYLLRTKGALARSENLEKLKKETPRSD